MIDRPQIESVVRETIVNTWPQRFSVEQLDDDAPLGENGLGLDSVEVVEVLFACEQACGAMASEDLFSASTLTIGKVIAHFCAAP